MHAARAAFAAVLAFAGAAAVVPAPDAEGTTVVPAPGAAAAAAVPAPGAGGGPATVAEGFPAIVAGGVPAAVAGGTEGGPATVAEGGPAAGAGRPAGPPAPSAEGAPASDVGRTEGVPVPFSAVAAARPARNIDGPPPGHTGGFGEPTCLLCHVGAELNGYGGRVAITGLPERYEPGRTYDLAILLEAEETAAAGFQLSARFAGGPRRGQSAGELAPLDARVAVKVGDNGTPYAQHTREGIHTPDPSGSTWTLRWTAPDGGGPVALNVAANSANGDDSPLSDLVYASEVVVRPEGRTGTGG